MASATTDNGCTDTHTCRHCQVPLVASFQFPQPVLRIPFAYSVNMARTAAKDGCPVFEELISDYRSRSLWDLLKTHVFNKCICCKGWWERFRYLFKSLSATPFQLLLQGESHDFGENAKLNSLAYFDCGNGSSGLHFNAYTYYCDPASSFLPSFDLEVDTTRTVKGVSEWLQSCTCSTAPVITGSCTFQPTRIIDLGEDNNSAYITVRESYKIPNPAYVCLSYSWGGHQPVVCTSRSIGVSGTWTILRNDLPQTFKDTIKVSQELNFRYLWIDSLCIVQDDPMDVEREILQMPQIYKNSSLTICASSARSCYEGFLHSRPDYSTARLQVCLPGNRQGTIYLDRILWAFPPKREPLSSRAWAVQERLLSPRLLEYGWRTARWSCSCLERYSGFNHLAAPNGDGSFDNISRTYSLFMYLNPLGRRSIAKSKDELFDCWTGIVQQYSSRNLSNPDDRLAAIGGVAAELETTTGVPYLAGIWDYDRLPSLLLWKVFSPASRLRPRPQKLRAPSWSWPSIDGRVMFQSSQSVCRHFKIVRVEASRGFGTTARGSIVLEGPTRTGSWWYRESAFDSEVDSSGLARIVGQHCDLNIWPDCTDEIVSCDNGCVKILPVDLTFVAIGRSDRDHSLIRGLLLINRHETSQSCIRVGLFQARNSGSFAIDDWNVTKTVVL